MLTLRPRASNGWLNITDVVRRRERRYALNNISAHADKVGSSIHPKGGKHLPPLRGMNNYQTQLCFLS